MNNLEFVSRLEEIAHLAGISRMADVTRLDTIGLPVFQAFRPFSKNYVVSQGKGETATAAKISACMESLEFYHGEDLSVDHQASWNKLSGEVGYDIRTLPLVRELSDTKELLWTAAQRLRGAPSFIPLDLISLDFTTGREAQNPFRNTSNGYGGGQSLDHALVHALLEVIERHDLSTGAYQRVSLNKTVEQILSPLFSNLRTQNMKMAIHHVAGPFQIPTFKVMIHQPGSGISFSGTCAHPNRDHSLKKAFHEAVQSRLTHFSASRDDLTRNGYNIKQNAPEVLSPPEIKKSFDDILPGQPIDCDVKSSLAFLEKELLTNGFSDILYKDLTKKEIGIPFVVVVVPGLKFTWDHLI